MKKFVLITLVLLTAISSCSREPNLQSTESTAYHPTITASIDALSTKVTLDLDEENKLAKIFWEEGDEITVLDASGHKAVYALSAGAGTTSGSFEFLKGQSLDTAGGYSATYGTEPSGLTEQVYSPASPAIFMTASSDDLDFAFTPECGVLKLSLTAPGHQVSKITVSDGTPRITLRCNEPVDISQPTDFFIAVPPSTYTQIKVFDDNGMVATKTPSLTVAANHIKPAKSSSLVYLVEYEGVTSGHDWVQLYEDGPRYATANVGASRLTALGTEHDFAYVKTWNDWGEKWTIPTKEELKELYNAASGDGYGQSLLDCYMIDNERVPGFYFVGNTQQTLFFPADPYSEQVYGRRVGLWSSTEEPMGMADYLFLRYLDDYGWISDLTTANQSYDYYLRPVLKSIPVSPQPISNILVPNIKVTFCFQYLIFYFEVEMRNIKPYPGTMMNRIFIDGSDMTSDYADTGAGYIEGNVYHFIFRNKEFSDLFHLDIDAASATYAFSDAEDSPLSEDNPAFSLRDIKLEGYSIFSALTRQ